ncbi:acyl-CoA dehydrogenase family protein [soil metagenome]
MNLREALRDLDPSATQGAWLAKLIHAGLDQLPLPGSGRTMDRWRALALVAEHDLSLVKLYEGHTDALAIVAEVGAAENARPGEAWATWAAEAPGGRVSITRGSGGTTRIDGTKMWCSGAAAVQRGLLTAWNEDGSGPQLISVDMRQPGIEILADGWLGVGMTGSAAVDVVFNGAVAEPVGETGAYLSRPGFWQGGAGIAACWFGCAMALANVLRQAVAKPGSTPANPYRAAALGHIDVALTSLAALLRESAGWMDAHPQADASTVAMRVRMAAASTATLVLDEAGRALGAGAFCRNPHFARMAADLPVFVRQTHGEQDYAMLGESAGASGSDPWLL